jgi:hypothetical protein
MALFNCPECNKQISDKALTCIGCGAPVEKFISCSECKNQVSENAEICNGCGNPLKTNLELDEEEDFGYLVIGEPYKLNGLLIAEHDFADLKNWDDAKEACEGLGEGWRLPTRKELYSIMIEIKFTSLLENEYWNFELEENCNYWSSSEIDESAWCQNFESFCEEILLIEKTATFWVRAVKSIDSDVIENNEVIDFITEPIELRGLKIASQDFPYAMNWDDAKEACEALGEGWRLPTKKELNYLCQNKDSIGYYEADIYWSSTEIVWDSTKNDINAWNQNLFSGHMTFSDLTSLHFVRAVMTVDINDVESHEEDLDIIGEPIKINDLMIAEHEFPEKMDWDDAIIACKDLGEGWRLPTKQEILMIYQNRIEISYYPDEYYWSANTHGIEPDWVYYQYFQDEIPDPYADAFRNDEDCAKEDESYVYYLPKSYWFYVRAVKTYKDNTLKTINFLADILQEALGQ